MPVTSVFMDAGPAKNTLPNALGGFAREKDVISSLRVTTTELAEGVPKEAPHCASLALVDSQSRVASQLMREAQGR